MQILIKQDFSPADIKKADLKRAEFRKNKATSEVSNLLNFIDLQRSIILCDDHTRKFNAAAYRYRPHPQFSRVFGNCDVCQQRVLGRFFLPESQWIDAMKQQERLRRDREYATIVS